MTIREGEEMDTTEQPKTFAERIAALPWMPQQPREAILALAREADDEIANLHLVAQGVKHYWRCTPEERCVRCRFDVFRAENDADELRALLVDLRAVEAAGWCDACTGTGQPASGEACMCGGTGLASAQVTYLRERLVEVEAERDTLRDALLTAAAKAETGRHPR